MCAVTTPNVIKA